MKALQIFRAGKQTDNAGITADFTEAHLAAAAAAYNPALHEAPIVVGHPRADAPAYGWVASLAAHDGALEATPTQVDAAFAEMVGAGRFKKISASFYLPDAPANPRPGVLYLRHVGFLGAQPPAVKGLRNPQFSDTEEGVVEFMDPWTEDTLAGVFRRLREWLLDKFDVDTADRVVPSYVAEDLAESARRALAKDNEPEPEPTPAFTESTNRGQSMPPETPTHAPTPTSAAPQVAAAPQQPPVPAVVAPALPADYAERETALSERERRLAERERVATRAQLDAEIAANVKAGRLLPRFAATAATFAETLEATATVEFAEADGKTVQQTPRDWFMSFLAAQPQAVNFGEASGGGNKPPPGDDPAAIARRITEFVEAERTAGRPCTYAAAASAVLSTD